MTDLESIAVCSGSVVIYWSSLIIALGIAAGFFFAIAIYTAQNGRIDAMWVFLPPAIILSVLFSRFLHWYCHEEQYQSFLSAMTDYSSGGYILQGALLGTYLGALLPKALKLCDNERKLLDAVAPGLALTTSFVRLSSLFNTTCHSKYSVETSFFQRLPFAVLTTDTAGNTDYRFATFFIEFLLLLFLSMFLVIFYYRRHNAKMKLPVLRDGHVFRIFLVLFSMVELVMDSTRNDSSFFHLPGVLKTLNKFLGFVSVGQLISAALILGIMIYYMKNSILANGKQPWHFAVIAGYLISLAAVGVLEYCVQRWSNMFRIIYVGMALGAVIMAAMVIITYESCVLDSRDLDGY